MRERKRERQRESEREREREREWGENERERERDRIQKSGIPREFSRLLTPVPVSLGFSGNLPQDTWYCVAYVYTCSPHGESTSWNFPAKIKNSLRPIPSSQDTIPVGGIREQAFGGKKVIRPDIPGRYSSFVFTVSKRIRPSCYLVVVIVYFPFLTKICDEFISGAIYIGHVPIGMASEIDTW